MKSAPITLSLGVLLVLAACAPSAGNHHVDEKAQNWQGTRVVDGTVDGGGGKGILCNGNLRTLDLYEAQEVAGWKLAPSAGSLEKNLETFGIELGRHQAEDLEGIDDPKWRDQVREFMKSEVIAKFNWMPDGIRLPLTKDATIPVLKPGCQEVQIAVYAKDGKIYVDKEYWQILNEQNQASLVMHEWVYARSRGYGAINSDESRKVIGMIFANQDPEPQFSPLWKAKDYAVCMGGGGDNHGEIYEFFVIDEVRNGVSGLGFYMRGFKSEYLLTRTSGFVPNISLADYMGHRFSTITVEIENKVRAAKWKTEIAVKREQRYSHLEFKTPVLGQREPPVSYGSCRLNSESRGPVTKPVVVPADPNEPMPEN